MVTLTKSLLIATSNADILVDWNSVSLSPTPDLAHQFAGLCSCIVFIIFCKTMLSMTLDVLLSDLSCLEKPDEIQQVLFILNQISAGCVTLSKPHHLAHTAVHQPAVQPNLEIH